MPASSDSYCTATSVGNEDGQATLRTRSKWAEKLSRVRVKLTTKVIVSSGLGAPRDLMSCLD